MSLKEQLKGRELAFEDVFVPEWGVTVRVREMTGFDRDSFDQECADGREEGDPILNLRARLLVRSLVDPASGLREFADEDAPLLGQQSGSVLARLFAVASRLSGIGKDGLEQAEKNSAPTPGGASSSASPSVSDAQSANYSPD